MKPFIQTLCLLLLLSYAIRSPAATIYSEDFSSPSKLNDSGATAELGPGGTYAYGTWLHGSGNRGSDALTLRGAGGPPSNK